MSDDFKDKAGSALYKLVSTPGGWIFLLGAIQIIGSSYVVFREDFDDLTFAYVDIILGSMFVLLAIIMWFIRAQKESEREIEIMRMDAEARRERRLAGAPDDKTIYEWKRRSDD